jgi:hypothetical protein
MEYLGNLAGRTFSTGNEVRRRIFVKAVAVGSAARGASAAFGADREVPGVNPADSRVFIRDDGRHAAGFDQFEPPLARGDVTQIVDQLAGSGVDTLLFSAGVEGGTVIYDSRVAQKLGDNVDVWTHPVHYRDARHIRQLIADGHDRIGMLCEQSHQNGLWFIASLCLGIATYVSPRGHGRTSDFVFDNPRFRVGEDSDPRAKGLSPTRFSFLHPEVREERFRIYEELLGRYPTDGVELLIEQPPLCRYVQAPELAPVLTNWLRRLRSAASAAEAAQGRRKRIFVTLPAQAALWSELGFDVRGWISERLVDVLVCTGDDRERHQQDLDIARAVELTRATGCRVLVEINSELGRQIEARAPRGMIWAAAANAYDQGADGVGLEAFAFPWPWVRDEYGTLRLLGRPGLLATADKIYRVDSLPRGRSGDGALLPRELTRGAPLAVPLRIADDLTRHQALGRVASVELRLRFTNLEPALNELRVQLNGTPLPDSILRRNDLTYRILRGGAASPYGYVYSYHLTPDLYPRRGKNAVMVELVTRDPKLDLPLQLYDLDCRIRYRRHRNYEPEAES